MSTGAKKQKPNGYVLLLVVLVSVCFGLLYEAYTYAPFISKTGSGASTTSTFAPGDVPSAVTPSTGIEAAQNLKVQLENRNQGIQNQ